MLSRSKFRFAAICTAAVFFWATLCSAGDIQLELLPMWETTECNGIQLGCYTLDQTKELLTLDFGMQLQLAEFDSLKRNFEQLDWAYMQIQRAHGLLEGVRARQEERLKLKNDVIVNLGTQLERLEEQNIWGVALPWILLTGLTLFAAGIGVGFWLGDEYGGS